MVSAIQISSLIGKAYDIGLDRADWPALAAEIGRFFDAPVASLRLRHEHGGVGYSAAVGIDPALSESYAAYYWTRDFLFDRICKTGRGVAHSLPRMDEDREIARTEFYNDYLKQIGCRHLLLAATLPLPLSGTWMSIALARTGGNEFTGDEAEAFSIVLSHLYRAASIGDRHESGADAETVCLDYLSCGVVVLSSEKKVLHCNSAAETLLAAGDILSIRSDRLCSHNEEDASTLDAAIAAALNAPLPGPARTVQLSGAGGQGSLVVLTIALGQRPGAPGRASAAVAVAIRDPEERFLPPAEHLRQLYGLTNQEARLADAILDGDGLGEVAKRLGIGRETARFHLKNVYQKTNAHSQVELAHILLQNPSSLWRRASRN